MLYLEFLILSLCRTYNSEKIGIDFLTPHIVTLKYFMIFHPTFAKDENSLRLLRFPLIYYNSLLLRARAGILAGEKMISLCPNLNFLIKMIGSKKKYEIIYKIYK